MGEPGAGDPAGGEAGDQLVGDAAGAQLPVAAGRDDLIAALVERRAASTLQRARLLAALDEVGALLAAKGMDGAEA